MLLKRASSYRGSLVLISGAFFLWGILRAQNDLLVALFNATGVAHYSTATLIHLSFFSAYFFASIPAGICLRRAGYRNTLCVSLALMALGSAIFVPAVFHVSFLLCLFGTFLVAIGIAILQTSANPCIGLLGAEKSATARLLLVQGCSAFGSAVGPFSGIVLFGGWSLRSSDAPLVFPALKLAIIYSTLTACVFAVVVLIWRYFDDESLRVRQEGVMKGRGTSSQQLRFGVLAVFLYVGCEATLLAYAIPFLSHHYTAGLHPGTAASLLSVYWFSVVCGRVFAAKLSKTMATRTLLQGSCFVALLLVLLSIFSGGYSAAACLLATGFCNAVVFPSIFNLSVSGLGEEELPRASALLSMAISGGGVMPMLAGLLADHFGVATAFILPSLGYATIAVCSGVLFPVEYR